MREFLNIGPGDVRVTTEESTRLKSGFRATLRFPWEISRFGPLPDLLTRIGFQVDVKGFPSSGQGLGWFAPMSALVLLYVVARRRAADDDFISRLGYAAAHIGALAASDEINVVNQAMPALATTVQAWTPEDASELWVSFDAEDEDGEEDGDLPRETSPEAAIGQNEDSALKIVRERYARGELTREEFQQLVGDLTDT